jgi:two-component system, OmpR family, sensor kinase
VSGRRRRHPGAARSGRLSSRQRLTLEIAAALTVLWTVIGWLAVRAVEDRVYDDIDDELTQDVADFAAALEVLGEDELREFTARATGPAETALAIIGPDGTVFVLPSGGFADLDPPPDLDEADIAELRGRAGKPFNADAVEGDEHYRVVTTPLADGRVLAAARPLGEVDDVLQALITIILVAFAATVAGAAILVWIISRQALRPIEAVISAAHDIGDSTTLDTRVEVTSTAPDVVRLTDALNVMLDRLGDAFARRERSEARLRQFVSDASHELRTPLAAIIGYAELHQQQVDDTDPRPADRSVGRILTEADRMQALIEDLLTLARLDEGRPLARDPVDLAEVVGDAVASVRAITDTHRFDVDLGGTGPVTLVGDAHALRRVVDNLLMNVVAHTPDGTAAHISLRSDITDIEVEVADDGPGMTDEQASHAFDRFWRAAPHRSRPGGSGLGLAIVTELVAAHRGRAAIDTGPGRGCRITIRLPAAGPDQHSGLGR